MDILRQKISIQTRLTILFGLLFLQTPFVAFLYDPLTYHAQTWAWHNTNTYLAKSVPFFTFSAFALAFLLWPKRHVLFADWHTAAMHHNWSDWLILNIGCYALLLSGTLLLNDYGGVAESPPWILFIIWCLCVALTNIILLIAFAPLTVLIRMATKYWLEIVVSLVCGTIILAATIASQLSWSFLSQATFDFSYLLLTLYETNIVVDVDKRLLGVENFIVNIAPQCSGYEGIGLVVTFLAIYIWLFRKSLTFPNVFILFPIGIALIWVLNAVRISVLISLGAHYSEDVALGGFHSQAGWMSFLLVTIGIMVVSHKMSFFNITIVKTSAQHSNDRGVSEAIALLAPFITIMLASVIIAAFIQDTHWSYVLKVLPVILILWIFRQHYYQFISKVSLLSVSVGGLVGILWVLTEPATSAPTELEVWVKSLGVHAAALWIFVRFLGLVLLVPIIEELAFRSYLHRALISKRFETVQTGQFTWLAFIVSSILFGFLHERWLAGILAGAVFALLMYRYNRLSDPIVAHMSANLVIAIWVLALDDWTLL